MAAGWGAVVKAMKKPPQRRRPSINETLEKLVLLGDLAQDAHEALGDVEQSEYFERQKATVDFLEARIVQFLNVCGLQGVGGGGHCVGGVRWCSCVEREHSITAIHGHLKRHLSGLATRSAQAGLQQVRDQVAQAAAFVVSPLLQPLSGLPADGVGCCGCAADQREARAWRN